MQQLRFRQVHLDFHTSEFIPGVAREFSAEEFAKTLKEAHVNSVTCFARCHHGYLYYPSKAFPEKIHPHLKNHNLLTEQIEACHRYDIKVPIYTTVQWDAAIAKEHPEWMAIDDNGDYISNQNVPEPHFYYVICLNSGYRDYFRAHLQDIIDTVGADSIDGFFMDILFTVDCKCKHCAEKMIELGHDPGKRIDRLAYSEEMLNQFKLETSSFVRDRIPGASIFYNSSHVGPAIRESLDQYTHLEIESLPGGSWGYMHFPTTVRYARRLGKEVIGMTGKFHTYWGDFHSFKNRAALEYECFQMLAMNAGCSIGDQLDPGGALSSGTYELIGQVYAQVEKKEPYCIGGKPVTEIAVLTPEEFSSPEEREKGLPEGLLGAVSILKELSYQFDIVDSQDPLEDFELVLLPDNIRFSPQLETKLREYVSRGGKVLGTYHSCLDLNGNGNGLYGISYEGESPYYRDFILPNDRIGRNLYREDHVMYLRGAKIEADEAEVLMHTREPYFDRANDKYCSHQHTPSSGRRGYPAVTRKGEVIYFAHPVFGIYYRYGARWCKSIVSDAIEMLLDKKLISHSGPSTLVTTINRQLEKSRDVVHLLHYIPEKRSQKLEIVEDVIPLYNIDFRVLVGDKKIKNIEKVPAQKSVTYQRKDDCVYFTVDEIRGHEMICITYLESI